MGVMGIVGIEVILVGSFAELGVLEVMEFRKDGIDIVVIDGFKIIISVEGEG